MIFTAVAHFGVGIHCYFKVKFVINLSVVRMRRVVVCLRGSLEECSCATLHCLFESGATCIKGYENSPITQSANHTGPVH